MSMFMIAAFAAAVIVIFAIHVIVLRKAVNEHRELLAMSWPPHEDTEAKAA